MEIIKTKIFIFKPTRELIEYYFDLITDSNGDKWIAEKMIENSAMFPYFLVAVGPDEKGKILSIGCCEAKSDVQPSSRTGIAIYDLSNVN